MTDRLPVSPAPGPVEDYSRQFDALFSQRNQRQSFRRYLEGLLLPHERNKTLTALANTEPGVGAQHPHAPGLQCFRSASTWDPDAVTQRRVDLLRAEPLTAPTAPGVVVRDAPGDRQWGTKTAHVGRQYLANRGKTDNGVVSVTSLWADDGIYQPLHYAPYTPAHHFAQGKADPQCRTKRQSAAELVGWAMAAGLPCRAVVADSFQGEDESLRQDVGAPGWGYVLALPPSPGWWQREGTIGARQEAVAAAPWGGADHPGAWVAVERRVRDGHTETWWGLEVEAGPYGPQKPPRVLVATTDPRPLPTLSTWYLITNLPAPGTEQAAQRTPASADAAEVVRLYGLGLWGEQSQKQTKSALGWSAYQVRSDRAIRRPWALVCCACAFWWDHHSQQSAGPARAPAPRAERRAPAPAALFPGPAPAAEAGRGEQQRHARTAAAPAVVAGGATGGAGVAGALDHAVALRARLVGTAPTAPTVRVA